MNTRFLNSVIATSQTTRVQMPWDRELKAERRRAKQAAIALLDLRAA